MRDVVFGGVNSALKETAPLSLPDGGSGNIMKGALLSATQGLLRPSAQVALNTLAFGLPITPDFSLDQYRCM